MGIIKIQMINNMIFKLFGVKIKDIVICTRDLESKYKGITFNLEEKHLDEKVTLTFSNDVSQIDVDNCVKDFILTFQKNIYAEEDVSLEKRLVEYLILREQTISVGESLTGGGVSAKIVSVDGASQVFFEGFVTYNTMAKILRLNVNPQTINEQSVVSSEVAYQMAKGLMDTNRCTISIATTGYAGSTISPNKDDGLCYIGIGTRDKIKVYKYVFVGSRNDVRECAINASLFNAIMSLKTL